MFQKILGAAAILAALVIPGVAWAVPAIATGNVNLRAGPSTAYPVVNVVRPGNQIEVHGCLSNRSWCDVSYGYQRGWMSSSYIAFAESGRRYVGSDAVVRLRAPVIAFSFGTYWDRHYRNRPFYRDRHRWEHPRRHPPRVDNRRPPRWQADRPRYENPRSPRRGDNRRPIRRQGDTWIYSDS